MEMRTPRWLLILSALTLLSGLGCGSDVPPATDKDDDNVSKPGEGEDEGEGEGDEEDKDPTPPAAGKDAGGKVPPKDAGPGTKPTGTDGGAGKDKDAGAGTVTDPTPGGDKDGGGSTTNPGDSSVSPGTGAGAGSCGPEVTSSAAELGDTKKLGPWKPMHVEKTGPTGASWVFYPEGFGKDGLKHPAFNWGPGAGTGPSNYLDHLNLLASYGFIVISQPSTNSGKAAIDWLLKQNETTGSMWFGKIDTNRVARGGHSMGALQSMSEAGDDRLKATVLVCGGTMSGNGGGGAAKITYPSIFLGGTGESGTRNFAGDYAEVKGPSVFVTHTMADHISCARDNMGPWVAFMRWHLCGEEAKWKKEFEAGGTYCKAPWEACKTKGL